MRALVRTQLEQARWDVIEASNADVALDVAREEEIDVVVLDLGLPDPAQGLELIERLQDRPAAYRSPIVVLTGENDPATVSEALGRGAHDYVIKPVTATELTARCAAALRVKRLQDALRAEAVTDLLTGLLNRRAGMTELERALAAAQRHGHRVAVLMMDVNGFKAVNDSHGHAAGDRLLRELAAALSEQIRDEDVLVRWGGDEFAVIIPQCDGPAAERAVERLASAARRAGTALSIGVAVAGSGNADTLLEQADQALYRAKTGREREGGAHRAAAAERLFCDTCGAVLVAPPPEIHRCWCGGGFATESDLVERASGGEDVAVAMFVCVSCSAMTFAAAEDAERPCVRDACEGTRSAVQVVRPAP